MTTTSNRRETVDVPGRVPPEQIPHACEPQREPQIVRRKRRTSRLGGIDLARAIALIGMISVHVLPDATDDGAMAVSQMLFAGTASALFAVLAGIGIAFVTGRTSVPRGRSWLSAAVQLAVRGVLIGLLGLALGSIPDMQASVILAFYGVLFILAIPLVRLRSAVLLPLSALLAIGMPLLSHVIRGSVELPALTNPGLVDLVLSPGATLSTLLLTGTYPALPWLAFVTLGIAIGRSDLSRRGTMLQLIVGGGAIAALSAVVSWHLLLRLGGIDALAVVAPSLMSRTDFVDLFVWGASGTLPTDSFWWLALIAPHTTTPLELLYRSGLAMVIIGATSVFAVAAPTALLPLRVFGSMPLTLYTAHLLLLTLPILDDRPYLLLALHLGVLLVFANAWSVISKYGPLEWLLSTVSKRVASLMAPGPERLER